MEFASSFLASWFTPSSLFILLNLIIGTIFLTARFGARKQADPSHLGPHGSPGQLARAHSSSLLDRVRSINLSLFKFDQHAEPVHAVQGPTDHDVQDPTRPSDRPSLLERLRSIGSTDAEKPVPETEREPNPKMKKSATVKVNGGDNGEVAEDEIAVEKRRPATTKAATEVEKEKTASSWRGLDECVDAKADDFINRFRHQLRLQRLESLKRFSDMIKGK